MDALNTLNAEEVKKRGINRADAKFKAVKIEELNPKSVNLFELYGYKDETQQPPIWQDGILSATLKRMVEDEPDYKRWMVIDGPVDTLWIESMNSVLDDSKLLTLNNGDRIALSPNVRLLFEVE